MSKPTKNLKKRLKAPRELVEATKKGERFVPAHNIDSRTVHVRRFSRAIAAYACVAMVLIAGVAILPMLLGGEPVAQSGMPQVTMKPSGYVKPTDEEAKDFVRPDLIWASHMNPQLENFVLWSADIDENGTAWVTTPFTRPDVGEDTSAYAVEVRIVYFGRESVNVNIGKRALNGLIIALDELGIKTLKNQYGYDLLTYIDAKPLSGNPYYSKVCELEQDQFTEAVEQVLMEKFATIEDARVEIRLAWQPNSPHPDELYHVPTNTVKYNERGIWFAYWDWGIETTYPFEDTWPVYERIEDKEYFVHISIESSRTYGMTDEEYSKFERQVVKMEEALKAAGFIEADLQVEDSWPQYEYYAMCYTVIGKDLSAFDSEIIMSHLREVDSNLFIEMKIMEPAENTVTSRR